jgi:hypothetical protein
VPADGESACKACHCSYYLGVTDVTEWKRLVEGGTDPWLQVAPAGAGGVPGVLGQAPAFLRGTSASSPNTNAGAPSGFDPSKPAADAPQQLVEACCQRVGAMLWPAATF